MNNETNDQRILQLKKQIEEKKKQLGRLLKPNYITNLIIEIEGQKQNINILTKEQLTILLIRLNMYSLSGKDLGIFSINISGYDVSEWIIDIKTKIEILSRKDEERNLKNMEEKLTQLLSEGKKVELELNEIESLLK